RASEECPEERAHNEGAGAPSGSGHAEPRSCESGDPRAAPDARRAGGRTSLERRTAGFAPSRDRALEAVDREAATDAVWAEVGEAGAADRAVGVAAGRTGNGASSKGECFASAWGCGAHCG